MSVPRSLDVTEVRGGRVSGRGLNKKGIPSSEGIESDLF